MNNTNEHSSQSGTAATAGPKWGPFVALGSTLRRYIQFSGRATRSEFWYTMLGHVIISLIILAVALPFTMNRIVDPYVFRILFLLYQAALALPLLALAVRRMHDIGRSGAALFYYFIPFVGPIILLIFLLTKSTDENQPKEAAETAADSTTKTWGPFVALGSTLRRYIQFNGRASRSEFWHTMLGHGLIFIIFHVLIAVGIFLCLFGDYNVTTCIVLTSIVVLFFLLYQAFTAIPLLALFVRRMHDIGRSGASLCFYFIPLVGPIILLIFLLTESNGANQYGEVPEPIADSSTGGNFINGIISIFARTHSSARKVTNTWCTGVLACCFILWLVTPSYLSPDAKDKDVDRINGVRVKDVYVHYRRGEIEIDEKRWSRDCEPFPNKEFAGWVHHNDLYYRTSLPLLSRLNLRAYEVYDNLDSDMVWTRDMIWITSFIIFGEISPEERRWYWHYRRYSRCD